MFARRQAEQDLIQSAMQCAALNRAIEGACDEKSREALIGACAIADCELYQRAEIVANFRGIDLTQVW